MRAFQRLFGLTTTISATLASLAAVAQEEPQGLPVIGKPEPGALGFQPAVTDIARDIQWFDGFLLYYITFICIIVMAAMGWVIFRYSEKANPKPATFTHNTPIEVAWTVIPALSLVLIALFLSLPILFKQLRIPEADVTIKATGNQWYWTYEYPDHEFEFDSLMLARDELEEYGYAQDEYLLATDYSVVIPVDATVVMQVTASDVIHAWTIPSFGVKQDGVPGRLAELWFKAEQEGVYFGQCSELCGKDHSYMPITVKVVSQEAYDAWLTGAIDEFAGDPTTAPGYTQVAEAE